MGNQSIMDCEASKSNGEGNTSDNYNSDCCFSNYYNVSNDMGEKT